MLARVKVLVWVRQGPAWEAQCHADTHLLLAALKALPLDPKTADSTMDHLATLCNLRFADPSPSGYAIPVPLPPPSGTPLQGIPSHSRTSPRRTAESPSSDQVIILGQTIFALHSSAGPVEERRFAKI